MIELILDHMKKLENTIIENVFIKSNRFGFVIYRPIRKGDFSSPLHKRKN